MPQTYDYDVIIVGGRAAGSTLAARLGQAGLHVLLLERAAFPSAPAASSPIIYASTMRYLDEIGADESAYARSTPKIRRMKNIVPGWEAEIPIPEAFGRDYAYAVDRARFDAALWDNALRFETVEGRMNFSVSDLLWDGERVIGITGYAHQDKTPQIITARIVVGADGRFSLVARKVGAAERDRHDSHHTSLYYAYWRGVKPLADGQPAAAAYGGIEPGYGYLVMDSADDTVAVCIEGQTDLLDPKPGKTETFYRAMIARNPLLSERLTDAQMVTGVHGMRRVGNLYRAAGGKGWALVGDAYHQTDPLDGQGIYNAVYGARTLARAIRQWHTGKMTWAEALAWYDEQMYLETYYMYKMLLNRVESTMFTVMPDWMQNTVGRWMIEDADAKAFAGKLLTRQVSPNIASLLLPTVMLRAVVRGGVRDMRRRLGVVS